MAIIHPRVVAAFLAAATCSLSSAYSFTGSSTRWGLGQSRLVVQKKAAPGSHKIGLVMKDDSGDNFNLSNIFGGSSSATSLEPHPSARDHINPLNLLSPSKARDAAEVLKPLPVHKEVKSGILPNGFSYVILPNRSPPGRFEAHLQVFSGSADELEPQQGIAHLTEHVAYMGSRKRERLFGTGSQTNAYTDFHHTVFYAACPTQTPRGNAPMLPMALDALCDVMEARVEPSRLEKERAAVLSEMTMVNTIEYRVECQILSTLHRENRLAKRFPIGKESLIRSWTPDDVKTWHRTHYRPDNVLLYIVGDVDPAEAEKVIADKFGHITAEKQASQIKIPEIKVEAAKLADAVVGATIKQAQSWHYPPVRHDWCVPAGAPVEVDSLIEPEQVIDYDIHLQEPYPLDDEVDFLKTDELAQGKKIRPHIFRHELLQAFSLHLFAKRPVEAITDLASFRRSLARRIALAALQIRLNVGGRSDDPAFTFVEFNQLDSAREGCAVCSLDLTAEPARWKDAICKSLSEIRKLGVYGVTHGEMERYAGSLMTDAEQLAAQGDMISHGDQLAYLMETVANGHTFMSPEQSYDMTANALSTLTLEEVNDAAAELCSHITSLSDGEAGPDGVVVATACVPKTDNTSGPEYVDEESFVKCILEAGQIPVKPEEDVVVPRSLVPESEVEKAISENKPSWEGGQFTDGTPNTSSDQLTRPFTLRRLGNGVRIGVAQNRAESQRGHLRLVAPGGRDAERRLGFQEGSMAVGARAMQEGGAFGPWSREQVELFCVDHLIMVEINCNEESLVLDFVFPTTNVGNTGFGENMQLGITGTEAVMQILREILVDFHWEEDALGRSKQSFRSAHESLQKNLEGKTTEVIMEGMTGNDKRFLSIDVDTVNAVTLDEAKSAVMSQLLPPELEMSVAGDFDVSEVLDLLYKYIGTIPSQSNSEYKRDGQDAPAAFGSVPALALPGKHLELELSDSDPRAVSYVAGAAPNLWGYLADGSSVVDNIMEADKRSSNYDKQRRAHPLFANVALALVAEIANRRLFSTVRERKQLTYDANFSFTGFERLKGGWFLVTVTASKENAQKALDACKETLEALRKSSPITPDNLESAKRVVLNRHEGELRTSGYWAMMMSGLQQESIPLKGPLSVTDFNAMVESITVRDLQLTLECLGLNEKELYTAIGKTVQPKGYVADEIVKASPMAGMNRGGALFMKGGESGAPAA
uniref:Peptidase M16 N-terminal domain-containing protein n=1 Tax=Odontella aurita TaxID=265563 RepID=A0A7S4HUK7_9STRA|mmetsp:Transcript_15384/g.44627  ORF Transcript_15384/g.44627 Transcript_15384/m.44627 type:complete len:1214 (+) Transcript_15384:224-3865(+)|eukprot:CAMPEP_0113541590 /NCGR_PEP_ID=MMETSP0015_2-20120614/9119_1 /TAXON_ID=2838 /ORGANISM="Odontella" /LENGTH=1213 /DNA_ID=CAMNT_0000441519 /DNA_START=156 /DNA_END=3797 /DNA_ORIENTATION=+ /assembly_acc=CAM_ASM_000160